MIKFLNGEITRDYAKELTWDFILENQLCSEETLQTITSINGYNIETLNAVIYDKTSYHDIGQLFACEGESFYFHNDIIENIDNYNFNLG